MYISISGRYIPFLFFLYFFSFDFMYVDVINLNENGEIRLMLMIYSLSVIFSIILYSFNSIVAIFV
uniref:Uncharacterized protein n=1 Tax=Rhizophora mucronata TaxID=61149 RepID=A0A2P2NZ47_RHIMU